MRCAKTASSCRATTSTLCDSMDLSSSGGRGGRVGGWMGRFNIPINQFPSQRFAGNCGKSRDSLAVEVFFLLGDALVKMDPSFLKHCPMIHKWPNHPHPIILIIPPPTRIAVASIERRAPQLFLHIVRQVPAHQRGAGEPVAWLRCTVPSRATEADVGACFGEERSSRRRSHGGCLHK